MFFPGCLLAATLITTAVAIPSPPIQQNTPWSSVYKRDTSVNVSDNDLLNFVLTLEHIQDALFRQGVQNYSTIDFLNAELPSSFYSDLKEISSQDSAHVKTLTSTLTTLGGPASAECTYVWPSIEGATGFILFAKTISGIFSLLLSHVYRKSA